MFSRTPSVGEQKCHTLTLCLLPESSHLGNPTIPSSLASWIFKNIEEGFPCHHPGTSWDRLSSEALRGHTVIYLSPCLFNLQTEHIMRNAQLDELQAGIKRGRRNNNLRYVDDNTLMAESKEELKSLLMRVKQESERAGLKLNVKKKKKTRSWHLAPLLHGK